MSQETNDIWVKKFRPRSVKQIILPSKVKRKINKIISSGILPNLLIYNPSAGCGKSSLSKSICNDMGITEVLYENGSGDVNIDFLRTSVTSFASTWSLDNKPKVVIIDDLGKGAHSFLEGLKSFSEKYSESCRFIITTNSLAHIPAPIKSRFELIEFNFDDIEVKNQVSSDIKKALLQLLKKLEIPYSEEALNQLISKCYPDIRSIIKSVQIEFLENGQITENVVKTISIDNDFYNYILEKKLTDARKYLIEKQVNYGEMYGKLFREFLPLVSNKSVQAQCILKISHYMDQHTTSIDPEITFSALLIDIMSIL